MAVVVLALAIAAAACGHGGGSSSTAHDAHAPRRVSSNVLRKDYAGSAACKDCHPKEYAAWLDSPMHDMTRLIDGARVQAPFDGASLRVRDDVVTMFEQDGARFVRVDHAARHQLFRVTKVIGGRVREDFAGIDVTDEPHPATDSGYGGERILPATWVFASRSWRYKGYSVMVPERPSTSTRARWAQTCIGCHNTLPTVDYLFDDLYGPKLPSYQGKVSDHLMPPSRDWVAHSLDDGELAHAIGDEIALVGGDRPGDDVPLDAVLRAGAAALRKHLDEKSLVEVGIGCEACHGGAAEHARDPHVLPSFEPRSDLLAVVPGKGTASPARWIDRACAKCHTVLFTRYPWTWEGAPRSSAVPGGSTTNSGEGRDFQLGGCASQMSCTHCHDPHAADDRAALDAMATVSGNTKCISCHIKYDNVIAVEAHSHHKASGAGASCVACHMPKKNMGLDYELERYHRIGSPTDRLRVERDRPLECALCHTDKSVEELAGTMERWWGKRYDRAALRGLYGDDLGVNVLAATIARGKPHEQAAAVATLGAATDSVARAKELVPLIVPILSHEYPLVRLFAKRALETITGGPVDVDVGAPAAEVRASAARWLDQWKPRATNVRAAAAP
ncbi:MAG TPA: cytochrome c3 family protein [Kofleriaceae bacterium]|nr:cytochrome c3 family protein [Kofleriaceae bacterium]